jgi:TPR repeat protein
MDPFSQSQSSTNSGDEQFRSFSAFANMQIHPLLQLARTDPMAMTFLAIAISPDQRQHMKMNGVPLLDPTTYLEKAINLGCIEAQYYLAQHIYKSSDTEEDGREALELLKHLIEKKYPPALNLAANIYQHNLASPDEARNYYQQAAELGMGASYQELAKMLLSNENLSTEEAQLVIHNFQKAIEKTNDSSAIREFIAASFQNPKLIPIETVAHCLVKQSELGDGDCAIAILELVGASKLHGSFATISIFNCAAEWSQTDYHAIPAMLDSLSNPVGSSITPEMVLRLAKVIADTPYLSDRCRASAYESIGQMYLKGIGVDVDLNLALSNFETGEEELNSGICARSKAYCLVKMGRFDEGFSVATGLMEEGDPESMALVGYCMLHGKGTNQNTVQGNKYIEVARQRGATSDFTIFN